MTPIADPSLPLSENQSGLWHLQSIYPALHAYNTSSVLRLRSWLDIPRLCWSLSQLVAQLPLLRTTFPLHGEKPQRVVHETVDPFFEQIMVSAVAEADLQHRVQAAHAQPFDLTTGPLVRLSLFTCAEDDHVLLLTFHHILLDFGSQSSVTQLLLDLYTATNTPAPTNTPADAADNATATATAMASALTDAPEAPPGYDDFVAWQQAYLAGPAADKARAHWTQQLQSPLPGLDLPTDRPLPRQQTFNGSMVRFALPPALSQTLIDLARRQRITPFALFLTAFAVLIARYSNQDDLVIGIPTDERLRAPQRFQQTLGHMVNILPIRLTLSDQQTLMDLAQQTQRAIMGGLFYQHYPFTRMVQDAQGPHDRSRSPLFDVVFNMPVLQRTDEFVTLMEGTPIAATLYRGLRLEPFTLCQQAAQTFLNLDLWSTDNGMVGFLKYNTDLFDETTIARMTEHFALLLESITQDIAQDINQPVWRLPLLSAAEQHQLVHEGNETARDFGEAQTIPALFEEQVARTPDAIALRFDKTSGTEPHPLLPSSGTLVTLTVALTYAELNAQANQLAHALIKMGVGPDIPVGICLERSPAMVVGLLGILKAGGAYVPLDPSYPAERLTAMLRDAQIKVLLTQNVRTEHPLMRGGIAIDLEKDNQPKIIYLDQADFSALPTTNPVVDLTPNHLIYLIYTSGSTGIPKGVEATHRNTFNRLQWMWETLPFAEGEILCQKTALSFVDSIWEIFGPLLRGIPTVIIPDRMVKDPERFVTALAHEGVTRLVLVPSLLQSLLDAYPDLGHHLPRLTYWTCSGEALSTALAQRFSAALPACILLNLYGSSEVAGDATWYKVDPSPGEIASRTGVPIGRPLANTQAYIVDQYMQPVPVGLPGELYIGGEQLARGYHNRPDLTSERFVAHPEFGRLYKTGDRCRWLADGTIDYIGRTDFQVKIRGFRIELGEIERALLAQEGVREAVVLAREDTPGNKRLVAYIVTESHRREVVGSALDALGHDPMTRQPDASATLRPHDPTTLRQALAQQLPDYMIPAAFVFLETMPLTPNGKVDRRALPVPSPQHPMSAMHVAPQSRLERQIATIWQELLGLAQVGVHDNFFELGGHSLLIVQMQNRLQKLTTARLAVTDCFQYPTVSALAAYLDRGNRTKQRDQPPSTALRADGGFRQSRQSSQSINESAIAIVGMACRFPGADSPEAFWDNLCQGKESIAFFTDEELLAAGVDPGTLNAVNYVKAGTLLSDIESFDAAFFHFTPREAEVLDPQQRLLLECASEAIESAGYNVARYQGEIGIYAGIGMNTYLFNQLRPHNISFGSTAHFPTILANDKDFVTTRVAYKLNLTGPAVTVQTACSTSLVAVHFACRSLLAGECAMALAGGASVQVPQKNGYLYQEGMITSPDGHCRAFSDSAQGTVGGNGVGVVLLKRLADALADGDTIHAVIKGSAINNDGSDKVSYTAPSIAGQAKVIREAQAAAGCAPETITYVEAHGTGTALGDPIEIAALTAAFQTSKTGYCAIGSVKTNIGHADVAAGAAGLIKTVLALKHQQLPPSLHFERPNPAINFTDTPFYVNHKLSAWASDGTPRRAGVSSFGIGGTNAHVVLEEAPQPAPSGATKPWQLLLLSAKSPTALDKMTANLAAHLRLHPELNLADVAYTLAVGRQRHPYRQMLLLGAEADATCALPEGDLVNPNSGGSVHYAEAQTRPVAFLFPGQGAQYVNMGRELYTLEPRFRAAVDDCAAHLCPLLGLDLRTVLYPPNAEEIEVAAQQLEQTYLTQPALFVVAYALAQLWLSWGITPQALIGHSIGEYVAATLAGVFSLDAALALIVARGRLMQQQPRGAMLAVSLAKEEIVLEEGLALAAVNSPTRVVVSGRLAAIDAYQQQLTARGISCRRLHTSHAFHSALMEPIMAEFVERVRVANPQPPQTPIVSNVTGTWLAAEDAVDPRYWANHLSQTVHFAEGLELLLTEPDLILIEVGPGQTLSTFARQMNKAGHAILRSLPDHQEQQSDRALLLTNLGQLWQDGGAIDWAGVYAHEERQRLALPTYPFERQRYWIDRPQADAPSSALLAPGDAGQRQKQPLAEWFYLPTWERTFLPPFPDQPQAQRQEERQSTAPQNAWLLFVDNNGVGAQLAQQLTAGGHDVITVTPGLEFGKVDNQTYTVAPADQPGYTRLIEEIVAQGKYPQMIVHLWSLNTKAHQIAAASLETSIEMNLAFTFDSLLFLAQALGSLTDAVALAVITNNLQEVTGEEQLAPEQATVLGPVKVIPQEFPHVNCYAIDVSIGDQAAVSSTLIDQLSTEINYRFAQLQAAPKARQPAQVVALRSKYRWAQTFQPVPLIAQDNASMNRPQPIRRNGVYLITGGLGGIGLALAEYLATFESRLVLVGRTPLPAREAWAAWLADHDETDPTSNKIRKIQNIEETGIHLLICCADVCNAAEMQQVVTEGVAHFGPFNGVIHAAGVPGGGMILRRTRTETHAVLAPKIKGAFVLDAVLRGMELDFMLFCSSLAAILGELGQVDYTAANAFLDAFAQKRNGTSHVVSINWDTWQTVGMAANTAVPQEIATRRQERLQLGLLPAEGKQAVECVLASHFPQVVVSTVDLATRTAPALEAVAAGAADTTPHAPNLYARPNLNSHYVAPGNETEQQLAQIWREILGVTEVGIHDDFFALGGDSLLATQLVARLRERTQVALPLTAIFDCRTIAHLADKLTSYQIAHAMQANASATNGSRSVEMPSAESTSTQNDSEQENREKEIW